MHALQRHNVHVHGPVGAPGVVLLHGFGCDQTMWRLVVPRLADRYRLVLVDHVGAGGADATAYDPLRHGALTGYADDVIEVCRELELGPYVLVGHSVSAMIGALAVARAPGLFDRLVMIAPSPRYVDDEGYVGGFSREDVEGLLGLVSGNAAVWSAHLAPVVMGNADRPALTEELAASFCRTDPEIAAHFAEVTFLSDNRSDLAGVAVPTIVLQTREDAIAPEQVGRYVHERISGSRLVQLQATGHCPHVSHPQETVAVLRSFLQGLATSSAPSIGPPA